jgi:Tol biopolymer transport system component
MPAGGSVALTYTGRPFLQFTPDGRVVYCADQYVDERFELFVVSLAGGTPKRLNPELPAQGDVSPGFAIAPDGSRIVYAATQHAVGVQELFEVALDGSRVPHRLNPPPVNGGDVFTVPLFEFTPDGSRVLLVGDLDTNNTLELYESFLERVPAPRKERTHASSQAPGEEHGPVRGENGR